MQIPSSVMERAIELKAMTSLTSQEPPQTSDFDMALNLVTCVRAEAGDCAAESLGTLHKIISNILADPSNPKLRRLRLANPFIRDKIARYDSSVALLELLGFQRRAEANEEVLEVQNFQTELAQIVLDLVGSNRSPGPSVPRFTPQSPVPVNRADFLANIHEQRLRSRENANMAPSEPQRPPESFLQLQDYRRKQKAQHPPSHRGVMTLADLDRGTSSPVPGPQHHSVADFEDARNIALRAFQLTNEFRASQRLPPLTWNDGLGLIGKGHSEDMGNGRVPFGHQGFNNRFRAFPFPFTRGGAENVAMNAGLADVAKVAVDGWINSPGHRKNMLGNFNYSGIGVVRNSQGAWYLTQLFALAH